MVVEDEIKKMPMSSKSEGGKKISVNKGKSKRGTNKSAERLKTTKKVGDENQISNKNVKLVS